MKNYYAILEVPVGCRVEEVRQAYHRLVQENLENESGFADLKEAYEVLTTPGRREEYDRAAWGETFGAGTDAPVLPLVSPTGRCPMGSETQCPVLRGRLIASDKFCPECGFLLAGLSMDAAEPFRETRPARQVWLEELGGQTHRLRPGLNIVGREGADVLLPDKTVSRQHARLDVGADGSVTVEDLSSTNGTAVGGDTLVPHVLRRLNGGDTVRFGSVTTALRAAAPPPAASVPTPASAPAWALSPEAGEDRRPETKTITNTISAALSVRGQVVQVREDKERVHPLPPGVTTFGRRTENSVVLPGDPYVSGSHAQILAEGDLFRLTDVGSTNGTLLNGKRMEINAPATLSEGDVILIGSTALRFERLPGTAPETSEDPEALNSPEALDSPVDVAEATETHGNTKIYAATDTPTPEDVEGTRP